MAHEMLHSRPSSPDTSGVMLGHQELQQSFEVTALLSKLEELWRQLGEERARIERYRAVIKRHLENGCPSRSLREVLLDTQRGADR